MIHKIISLKSIEPDNMLYHYTKCNGAQGIISDKSIRATRSDFLNDTNEICYILAIVKKVIDEIGNEKWRKLLKTNIIESINQAKGKKYYIAAFSSESDSITLWAEFGDNTGYNVAFDSNILLPAIEKNQTISYHGFVIYSEYEQKQIIRELINNRIPFSMGSTFEDIMDDAAREDTNEKFQKYCRLLKKAIGIYALFFKQEEFTAEKEYRFAFKEKSSTDVRFREKDGFLVPYIMIDVSNGKKILPILGMTVAPKNHIDLAREGMQLYLQHNGYDVKVKLSRIKLRY